MKIIKNRYIQVVTILLLIVGVTFAINHFTEPVMASSELSRIEFNKKIEEIENEFFGLKEEIELLKTNIETLNNDLNEANEKIISLEKTTKETQNAIKNTDNDINKLNKWYNQSKELYSLTNSPIGTKIASSDDYIKHELIKFFEQN